MEKRLGEAANEAEAEIESLLREIEPWSGRELHYGPVHGGISNSNWRVRVAGEQGRFFVKVPGRGTEMFIDRNAALDASRRAQDLGIGPKIYEYLADRGVEIADYIEGRRACTNRDFQDPTVRKAVVGLYRTFNDSGRLPLTKTIFDMIDEHIEQVRELNGAFPIDFAWLYKQYRLARAALEASGIDLVACFNDPMAGNFMVAEDKSLMLIDYEYASNNDRCYDIGIWCGEMFFSDAVEAEVIEEYFGRFDPRMKARLAVHRALADVKWSTWAMVQNVVSALDFDFYKYGAWKHMRARAAMQDPRWVEYLKAV
ncbi:choline/ethanolamine kinase--aminoglycoside phosphotransferase [Rhizobium leguminosarum]|uniref:choline/ethanolamine kinase family protein n=1 Tax=Rhizobium TaxID=379 RepID=UPI00102F7CF7|nr:choline/ethanolamine kinase family protein [Rhizobium leguminosarum]TBF28140.1 choline/ethanolamine kinase--aminoglycoside phosphotransferase [Rhizobium leguminosarum]TBF28609.1 choline/ethanolamine kinase--aminoglycoside phosphotransferase [Rhizobium leguminosarum]TBF46468.1 choline/ethanolamine kinase--aminoglycoside phosphotransferase [Rhizobium leguminosarum]TBF48899.1 choline/ethanolamine kinase--aminoglycoside phosphotransferase [Rhizobium leguminosarum]TBF50135.1 choline/ethanolamine